MPTTMGKKRSLFDPVGHDAGGRLAKAKRNPKEELAARMLAAKENTARIAASRQPDEAPQGEMDWGGYLSNIGNEAARVGPDVAKSAASEGRYLLESLPGTTGDLEGMYNDLTASILRRGAPAPKPTGPPPERSLLHKLYLPNTEDVHGAVSAGIGMLPDNVSAPIRDWTEHAPTTDPGKFAKFVTGFVDPIDLLGGAGLARKALGKVRR